MGWAVWTVCAMQPFISIKLCLRKALGRPLMSLRLSFSGKALQAGNPVSQAKWRKAGLPDWYRDATFLKESPQGWVWDLLLFTGSGVSVSRGPHCRTWPQLSTILLLGLLKGFQVGVGSSPHSWDASWDATCPVSDYLDLLQLLM